MYACKSSTLINCITKSIYAKKRCLIINHSNDTRYDDNNIVTHNNNKIPALMLNKLSVVDITNYDCIFIDEGQFFIDVVDFVKKCILNKKEITVAGLNGDFNQNPLGYIQNLLSLATKVTYLTAVCVICGNDAQTSYLKTTSLQELLPNNNNNNDLENVIIGSENLYEARCYRCKENLD